MCDTYERRALRNKRYRIVEKLKAIPRREYLMTIRYDDETHQEMMNYSALFHKKGIRCVYGSSKIVSEMVVTDSIMFILEMNNDKNKIVGVGLVRNTLQDPVATVGRRLFDIHKDGNLNRHVYIGSRRIAREDMTDEENEVFLALDYLCFCGNTHMKRCHGITMFPLDVVLKCKTVIDLPEYIKNMFRTRQKTYENVMTRININESR